MQLSPNPSESAYQRLQLALGRLADSPSSHLAPDAVISLPGGASPRSFFRVPHREGTVVAMVAAAPACHASDARQTTGLATFVEVAQLLRDKGARVPDVFQYFPDLEVALVEDLGDSTLAEFLHASPQSKTALYQQALGVLISLQTSMTPAPLGSSPAQRLMDPVLLRWELDHFVEWALPPAGITLGAAETPVWQKFAQWLCETICSWPRGFVHRDFQSRNLMVLNNSHGDPSPPLAVIDFQDAMQGPRTYDLVGLLADSYQHFQPDFVAARLEEYRLSAYEGTGHRVSADQLRREFALTTVQRKLKDAGRFHYLASQGKGDFLPYVQPALASVEEALAELQEQQQLVRFRRLFQDWLPRLGDPG